MRAVVIIAGAALVASCGGGGHSSRPTLTPPPVTSVDTTDPLAWNIGPVINGANVSVGMPEHPSTSPDGPTFLIPEPTKADGHVHEVTLHHGPLTGKTRLVLRYRVDMEPGVKIVAASDTSSPSMLSLYFQRSGDNWSARGAYEAFRWYSPAVVIPIVAGEHELAVGLDANWTAALTSTRSSNPAGFKAAIDNADKVGFVLGGGTGRAHGVFATGPAQFTILEFRVQ